MLVSIFIPTFNSSAQISETLDSILMQTYKDIEIICVDDGSCDNTTQILRAYTEKDDRIKYFQKENEGSVPFSWNYVFPHLQGEFTLYMSHDDVLEPYAIEKLIEKQKTDSEIDCVIPSLVFFQRDFGHPEVCYKTYNQKNDMSSHPTVSGVDAFDEMLDYSIPGFALWRTELIRKIGMPTESFNSDECMQRVWVKNCRKVAFSDAKFGYRQSSNSIVKGLKSYHFFSLSTNLRLFHEMMDTSISLERKHQMQYSYFQSLAYLHSRYLKMKKDFSQKDQSRLECILAESFRLYRDGLKTSCSVKGFIYKAMSLNSLLYKLGLKIL